MVKSGRLSRDMPIPFVPVYAAVIAAHAVAVAGLVLSYFEENSAAYILGMIMLSIVVVTDKGKLWVNLTPEQRLRFTRRRNAAVGTFSAGNQILPSIDLPGLDGPDIEEKSSPAERILADVSKYGDEDIPDPGMVVVFDREDVKSSSMLENWMNWLSVQLQLWNDKVRLAVLVNNSDGRKPHVFFNNVRQLDVSRDLKESVQNLCRESGVSPVKILVFTQRPDVWRGIRFDGQLGAVPALAVFDISRLQENIVTMNLQDGDDMKGMFQKAENQMGTDVQVDGNRGEVQLRLTSSLDETLRVIDFISQFR